MKRAKRIYILIGILAVVIIATFAVSRYEERVEQINNSKEVILDLNSDDATDINWETEDYSYGFHKDGSWVYDEDAAFPVNDEKIDSLIDMFTGYEADFVITEVEDYSQYGLDDPVGTLNITTNDGTYTITMGAFSPLDEERYICINGGDVYLVARDPLKSFELEMADLLDHDTVDSISQADKITFEGTQDYSIYYDEDSHNSYCADDVYFVSGSNAPLDTTNVKDYLADLTGLYMKEFATYNASDEELELFGMNDPVLVVTLDYTDTDEDDNEIAKTVTLTIGQNQEELKASMPDEDEENADSEDEEDIEIETYIRVNDSQIIYDLDEDDYRYLTAVSYNDLRHADILPVDFADVTRLDIAIDGTTYTIYSETEETEEEDEDEEAEPERFYYYYYDGKEIDPEELEEDDDIENYRKEVDIDDLSSYIQNITAESFTDEAPADKEEISLTVYLDNEDFPQVKVDLYRYDGSSCLAVVDNVPVSLVPRQATVDLIEAVYEIVL